MYWWMTVGGIAFLFISTALGAALVFCLKNTVTRKQSAIFLGFTSGIMLAASVWSLIIPALQEGENGWGRYAFIPVSIGIFVGAIFLWGADKLLPSTVQGRAGNNAVLKNPFKLFFAITLHNIPEGLAVGFAFGAAWAVKTEQAFLTACGLAFGIGIQNLPEGAAVALPMRSVFQSKKKAFLYGAASGVCEAVFAVLGVFLAVYLRSLQTWLLAFSAGAMIFVVAEELLPSANSAEDSETNTSNYTHAAWGVIVGFILMLILDVALG
ncbi:MAG: ZIP family metal transporter [Clostridia bacterium]|nr:ZIP family metal transporter [Clostridia bacterium]